MSWLNYVVLGKVYEMKGESRLAADAYITAFNLRPGDNTLYWIQNGIFQTSIEKLFLICKPSCLKPLSGR